MEGFSLGSEEFIPAYKSLVFIFENCREYDEAENCASEEATNAFWATHTLETIWATFSIQQVDMKNVDSPVSDIYINSMVPINPKKVTWKITELAPNEFTSYEDYYGVFPSKPDPTKFFSIENKSDAEPPSTGAINQVEGLQQPYSVLEFVISGQKYEHERRFYTLMSLIGDFGGFQGAIIMFPVFFLSFYASNMFESSLLEGTPVKK